MSVLRKAKEKAREGIRAVNTERKKHFGSHASTSRPRGTGYAPGQSTSYNFKQMKQTNDAFEAILDDESELFGMETEWKPKPVTSNDHLDSVESAKVSSQSQSFNDDLFSDDFEPPSRETGDHEPSPGDPLVSAEETDNDESIPADDVTEEKSPSQPQLETSDRTSHDGEIHVEPSEVIPVSEPHTTESTDTPENQGNAITDSLDHCQEQNTLLDPSDQGNTILNALSQENVTLGTGNHSQEQSTVESEHEQPSGLIGQSNKQERSTQDDLFTDTFSTGGTLPVSLTPPTNTAHLSTTPLSSSVEDDYRLSPSAASPDKAREVRGVSSERSDDELASTTALIEELLSPKPNTNPHPLQVPSTAHDSRHLDSGIFDNESHKRSSSDDIFEVSKSHYGSKESRGTSFTSPGVSPHKPAAKRNSAGKLPPERPPISPSVRRRLNEKVAKKDRLPADDLFEDDFVSVPYPNQSKRTIPPRPSLAESSIGVTPSPDSRIERQDVAQTPQPESKVTPVKRQDSHMLDESDLTLPYHLALALTVYIYYSLNPWSYLAGFLAGFLMMYLVVGTAFVWYVVTQEHERKEKKRETLGPLKDFLRRMDTNFDDVRTYQNMKFMATMKYDSAHPLRDRVKAHVTLEDDFFLNVKLFPEGQSAIPFKWREDLRNCTVSHAPEDIATERKRRWNKKFPICVSKKVNKLNKVYLFSPTSRDKEDWFRRLRHAADGHDSEHLINHLKDFFTYMQGYFPTSSSGLKLRNQHLARRSKKHAATRGNRIQYSRDSEDSVLEEDNRESVSITRETGPPVSRHSRLNTPPPQTGTSVDRQSSTTSSLEPSSSIPPSLPSDILWLNAVAARMCWDVWHDQRWKDWVKQRIQKKLAKVKTPPFMEQLTLTDVDLGKDMPVVNKLVGGPRLDLRGMWVYLDVTYEGCFVMTITTRLKLGKEKKGEEGRQMSELKSKGAGFPPATPHTKTNSTSLRLSHTSAARALGSSMDPYDDEIDSGSSDEESSTLGQSIMDELHRVDEPPEDPAHSSRRGRLKHAVKKFGKKVANSGLVQKAFEKVSSYPLVLTVVVNRLDGVVAVNIPPPRTDTIWFAFVKSPHLELTAKPKLGQREVKLSAVTQWIEKKLCDVVDKKLVLPEMEDLVVGILNSGLPEDTQKVLVNDN